MYTDEWLSSGVDVGRRTRLVAVCGACEVCSARAEVRKAVHSGGTLVR
jgi:hypothetical protein